MLQLKSAKQVARKRSESIKTLSDQISKLKKKKEETMVVNFSHFFTAINCGKLQFTFFNFNSLLNNKTQKREADEKQKKLDEAPVSDLFCF